MNNENLEVLNVIQQVLRHLMLALAAGGKADLGDIGIANTSGRQRGA